MVANHVIGRYTLDVRRRSLNLSTVATRLPTDTILALLRAARERRSSVSELIREAVLAMYPATEPEEVTA